MFGSVLIANRGEIACRIARTCRRLGIRTVAVYSDADAGALHVRACDAAIRIGPPPARESYLDGEAVLAAARESRAEAIHPGYGFLSENAGFAEAVGAAGFAFVGAPPAAIRALGSKSAAKALMARAGVPILAGYHGAAQDDATLSAETDRIGYPLLVKPAAGGGGRGMRIVEDAAALGPALESARREAVSSFGDDRLLLERYLAPARHIEVQVFADTLGNTVHLFERDCSAQRRHQKVIEEAPAPGLSEATRDALGRSAVAAAEAVGYVGAGTVEFLIDGNGEFSFIEMNTRLQVEHPVTEMVTGYDLVEWQLRVAAGEALPAVQDAISVKGHAIEARLYAEDPAAGFLPSTGPIRLMRLPGGDARIDTGFEAGDAVTPHYDSLLAKVIVHAPSRATALAKLAAALAEVAVAGPVTNRDFLIAILAEDAFVTGTLDTGHLDRNVGALTAPEEYPTDAVLALAALATMRDEDAAADPGSPWTTLRAWRLNAPALRAVTFRYGGDVVTVAVEGADFRFPDRRRRIVRPLPCEAPLIDAEIDGETVSAVAVRDAGAAVVFMPERTWRFPLFDPVAEAESGGREAIAGVPLAPMPGVVVAVSVAGGERVEKNQPLLVIEAMKVEHTIRAPSAGTVDAVHYEVGDRVDEGAELAAFTPDET